MPSKTVKKRTGFLFHINTIQIEERNAFKANCASEGKTMTEVLGEFIEKYNSRFKQKTVPATTHGPAKRKDEKE